MSGAHLPANWRNRLPAATAYFGQRVHDLGQPTPDGWARGTCPFHQGGDLSLSVHLAGERGHWRCSGPCGAGDLVGFHMRLTGLDFKAAVRELVSLEYPA